MDWSNLTRLVWVGLGWVGLPKLFQNNYTLLKMSWRCEGGGEGGEGNVRKTDTQDKRPLPSSQPPVMWGMVLKKNHIIMLLSPPSPKYGGFCTGGSVVWWWWGGRGERKQKAHHVHGVGHSILQQNIQKYGWVMEGHHPHMIIRGQR